MHSAAGLFYTKSRMQLAVHLVLLSFDDKGKNGGILQIKYLYSAGSPLFASLFNTSHGVANVPHGYLIPAISVTITWHPKTPCMADVTSVS
jgi:hypothetical protein